MKKKNAQKRLEEYMKVHFGGKTALGIVLFHVLEEGGGLGEKQIIGVVAI